MNFDSSTLLRGKSIDRPLQTFTIDIDKAHDLEIVCESFQWNVVGRTGAQNRNGITDGHPLSTCCDQLPALFDMLLPVQLETLAVAIVLPPKASS